MRLGRERHCPQRHVKHGQDPNEGTSRAQGALQNRPLRAMCIPRPATSEKKCLGKAANTRQADIEGKAGKEEWGSEPTCAELIGGGADEAVDLFKAEDDMVLI
jgi:hypothetical protein